MPSVHLWAPEVDSLHKHISKMAMSNFRSAILAHERNGPACYAFLAFKAYEKHPLDTQLTPIKKGSTYDFSRTEKNVEGDKPVPLGAEI